MKNSTQNIVLSGFFLALGLVLPFITGQIPSLGNRLLPMHIPIILCGFICGCRSGLIVGFITPIFRSMIFGMPPMYPIAAAMAFELAVYGFTAGLFYRIFPHKRIYTYLTLFASMLCGRIVWGIVSFFIYGISGTGFTWKMFMAGALINAFPGILIQILFVPLLVFAFDRVNSQKDGIV
ncbi:MAG: ECF transporter S component [Eubacteriales bacterium]|nr:ECF transporter S component [Eubacteriales bacterium]MDD4583536.1 ECF transporter S component [Eubacteriales bacterium]